VFLVIDIIWFLVVVGPWSSTIKGKQLWNSLHGMHMFGLVIAVTEMIVKVPFLTKFRSFCWYI